MVGHADHRGSRGLSGRISDVQIYEGAVRREGVGLTLRLAYGIIDETGGTGRTA